MLEQLAPGDLVDGGVDRSAESVEYSGSIGARGAQGKRPPTVKGVLQPIPGTGGQRQDGDSMVNVVLG